jgi:hypothetical protein
MFFCKSKKENGEPVVVSTVVVSTVVVSTVVFSTVVVSIVVVSTGVGNSPHHPKAEGSSPPPPPVSMAREQGKK